MATWPVNCTGGSGAAIRLNSPSTSRSASPAAAGRSIVVAICDVILHLLRRPDTVYRARFSWGKPPDPHLKWRSWDRARRPPLYGNGWSPDRRGAPVSSPGEVAARAGRRPFRGRTNVSHCRGLGAGP